MSEWFPVTKLLPTEEDRKRNDGQFLCYVIFPENVIVTHWRYLPEDPEEVTL